jgi:hypothetical protein
MKIDSSDEQYEKASSLITEGFDPLSNLTFNKLGRKLKQFSQILSIDEHANKFELRKTQLNFANARLHTKTKP